MKTVREIAEMMETSSVDFVKVKQRIRDEIKRQNINVTKKGNRFVVADGDVEKIKEAVQSKGNEESSKIFKKKEIRRLNLKIEEFADDFKELNSKQLQLNNQQQLQARILEQTKQLNESQQKLISSAERSSQLQEKVEKIENASLWKRTTRNFD
ncbi:hypothetical protein [Lactobacillus iners]|uniref:hypothetical protein n=1 Tax=Lactobacillus iners TaxID=147802 RepID=UPI003EBD1F3A|nr:hypothetical protein [Lactobacillus iners]